MGNEGIEVERVMTEALRRVWAKDLDVPTLYEPHVVFKKRVPNAIGLIRTGDSVIYANLILESA